MSNSVKKLRQHLSIDSLYKSIKSGFEKIKESNEIQKIIPLSDVLMSGFALFAIKEPSLLSFDKRRIVDKNLRRIFQITTVPSDTQMRKRLDPLNPKELAFLYKDVFRQLQRGKVLEQFQFMDQAYTPIQSSLSANVFLNVS
jgi:hypothetical protein